jgi:hypothetical protein
MRVKARGAYHMAGVSKKTGNAYEMCNLVIEVPQETVATATMKRVAFGCDQKELQLSPACFERMKAMSLSFPCELDVTVGAKVGFRGLESIIDDVQPVKPAAVVASPVKAA